MQASQHMVRTGRRGLGHEYAMAFGDLVASLRNLGLAWSLAWHDVIARYRGSIIGPFWITLSMGFMVAGIGFLYAHLFQIPVQQFVPYVACGIVFWGLIANMMVEGCGTYTHAAGMLNQTALPMFTFVWRTALRNIINLGHHMVIILAVLLIYGQWRSSDLPAALLGFLLVMCNLTWISLLAGIASARFRDVPQIMMSLTQFAMFITPVFWHPGEKLMNHALLVFNPFFHMLEAVRAPLLGQQAPAQAYIVLAVMALAGWASAFVVFTLTRRRIVHYL